MRKMIFLPFVLCFTITACTPLVQITPSPTPLSTLVQTTPSPTPSSGIEGQVLQGPMCGGPVRAGTNDCPDQPYQATLIVLDSNGNQVIQLQSDQNGYFTITLEPGTYILHPVSGKPLPRAVDQTVVVIDGKFTQITITYDTGMR